MYYFTIRDIENLTGIKAHTLRIWEQRYKLLQPKRKQSNHRLYDNEDLKQLLRISFLYHQGWKISKLDQLTPEQLNEAISAIQPGPGNYRFFIAQLIACAIDLDKECFTKQLDDIINITGFENCIVHVCYPYLQKIGLLWMTNHVIPAQEHFSSYIIQHKIIAATDKLPLQNKAPEILLFCPHGEYHELPLFYMAYLLKKWGWSVVFLGSSVPFSLIAQFAAQEHIGYLFLHVITNFTGFTVDDYFEKLCQTFANKKIIATGSSVFSLQRSFTNLTVLRSDDEIYRFIRKEIAV